MNDLFDFLENARQRGVSIKSMGVSPKSYRQIMVEMSQLMRFHSGDGDINITKIYTPWGEVEVDVDRDIDGSIFPKEIDVKLKDWLKLHRK